MSKNIKTLGKRNIIHAYIVAFAGDAARKILPLKSNLKKFFILTLQWTNDIFSVISQLMIKYTDPGTPVRRTADPHLHLGPSDPPSVKSNRWTIVEIDKRTDSDFFHWDFPNAITSGSGQGHAPISALPHVSDGYLHPPSGALLPLPKISSELHPISCHPSVIVVMKCPIFGAQSQSHVTAGLCYIIKHRDSTNIGNNESETKGVLILEIT